GRGAAAVRAPQHGALPAAASVGRGGLDADGPARLLHVAPGAHAGTHRAADARISGASGDASLGDSQRHEACMGGVTGKCQVNMIIWTEARLWETAKVGGTTL